MPRSAWFSFERLPFTLTPNPAEPESFRGISKVKNSRVPSGVSTKSSSSAFYNGGETEGGEREECLKHNIPLEKHIKPKCTFITPESTLSMTEKKNVPEGTIVHISYAVQTTQAPVSLWQMDHTAHKASRNSCGFRWGTQAKELEPRAAGYGSESVSIGVPLLVNLTLATTEMRNLELPSHVYF